MASIRQRGKNSYLITVSCGYDCNDKKLFKQKTIKRPEGMTDRQWDKEINKIATEFELSVQNGDYYEPSKFTLSDFIDKWLSEHGKNLENKTYYRYESMLKGRVTEALGHLKLDQLKPLHLLDFYRNLQENGIREDTKYIAKPELQKAIGDRKLELTNLASTANISVKTLNGILSGNTTIVARKISNALKVKLDKIFIPASDPKPLSSRTILHYHRVISVMLNDAYRWGMIKENPCLKVQPPKVKLKEMECLNEEGFSNLYECLLTEPIKEQAIIMLALMTGCRRGELAALQWEHVDLDNEIIHIKQAAEYTPATGIKIKQPKTNSSIRKIAIPKSLVQTLKQYKVWQLEQKVKMGTMWQKEEKEKQGELWKDPEWLFTTIDGYIIHVDTLTETFKKFLKRHNLPNIRLHDLRHTAATMLIHSGLNIRAVASRLGHANPSVTLAVYSHALQSADREAANVMESLITKNTASEKQA